MAETETLDPNYLGSGNADDELYRENILDHFRNPRNFGRLQQCTMREKETNPVCGDEIEIFIHLKDETAAEVKFFGKGCAISQAAASMLTEHVKGKSLEEIQKIQPEEVLEMLGISLGFIRKKCGLLCLKTLQKALKQEGEA